MREIVINVYCDVCEKSVAEEDARAMEMSIDGVPYEADFCHECHKKWTVPLRPVNRPRDKCHLCDKTYATQWGLKRHEEREH